VSTTLQRFHARKQLQLTPSTHASKQASSKAAHAFADGDRRLMRVELDNSEPSRPTGGAETTTRGGTFSLTESRKSDQNHTKRSLILTSRAAWRAVRRCICTILERVRLDLLIATRLPTAEASRKQRSGSALTSSARGRAGSGASIAWITDIGEGGERSAGSSWSWSFRSRSMSDESTRGPACSLARLSPSMSAMSML
jgi:hypothetical protein